MPGTLPLRINAVARIYNEKSCVGLAQALILCGTELPGLTDRLIFHCLDPVDWRADEI